MNGVGPRTMNRPPMAMAPQRFVSQRPTPPAQSSSGGVYALLAFKNLYLFPLVVIAGFYGAQSLIGYMRFRDEYSQNVLIISVTACLTYLFSYKMIFSRIDLERFLNRPDRFRVKFSHFALVFLILYAVLIIYTAMTANEVALFSALRGASLSEIAERREEFLRTRTGWEASLKYIYNICTTSVVPYIVAVLFYIRHKLRTIVLVLFLFVLMLTLEKSLAIMALFPLVVLFANQKSRTRSLGATILLVGVILGASYLALGGMNGGVSEGGGERWHFNADYVLVPETNYSIFGFVANRIAWIPYMTAYDWLRFQNDVLRGDYTMGSSINFVSSLLGEKHIALERAVFAYEWGQNETNTGSSNTAYFIESYLDFGIVGAIIYSLIFAFLVRIISVSDNIPAKAAAYVPVFYVCSNSLTAVLFSGGLGLILIIMFFLQPISAEIAREKELRERRLRQLSFDPAQIQQRRLNSRTFRNPQWRPNVK